MTRSRFVQPLLFYVFASILAVFALIPFFWMVSTSLKSKGALISIPIEWIPEKISFEGYSKIFTVFPFAKAIFNSLFISVASTGIVLVSALMAAYVFAKIEFKGREAVFALFLATMMVPGQVTMIPVFLVLKEFQLLNSFTGLLLPSVFNPFAIFMLRQFI